MNIIPILQSSFSFLRFVQSDRLVLTHIDIYTTLSKSKGIGAREITDNVLIIYFDSKIKEVQGMFVPHEGYINKPNILCLFLLI